MKHISINTVRIPYALRYIVALAVILGSLASLSGQAKAAACSAPSTDYGSVSTSVSLPAAATYRVWTRMLVPDTTNNTYLLEIDGANCYNVGGGGLAVNAWTWVAYQGGNTGSKVDVSLGQGNHTLKLIGNKPNVKVDRVVFTSDLTCTPSSSSGTECNTSSDTTPPTVRITSPTANATVSGTITVNITATDNTSVTKTEFYVNSSLVGTDTSSPYSFQWKTADVPNGTQLLTAKGYDAAGNIGTDSFKVSTKNGDQQPPSIPTGLTGSAPSYNKIVLNWKASTDSVGVKGYTVIRDGIPVADAGNVTTYTDTQLSANTAYTYQVLAYDAAGNKSAGSDKVTVKTQNVADSQAPSAPTNLTAASTGPSQVNLSWTASTDNIGITAYDIYRSEGSSSSQKIATITTISYGDTNLKAATQYTYYVIAKDGAGNSSSPSSKANVMTKAIEKKSAITGTISDSSTHKGVSHAAVVVSIGSNKHIYQSNKRGQYTVRHLEAGRYNVSYRAPRYFTRSFAVPVATNTVVTKNVALQKR